MVVRRRKIYGSKAFFQRILEEIREKEHHQAMLSAFPAEAEAIAELNAEIKAVLNPIQEKFQAFLLTLEGKTSENFEANEALAILIQETADALRVAFACPKPGCGAASRFRCALVGTSKTGVFSFCHKQKTHGGSSAVPRLTLTPIQPRLKQTTPAKPKKMAAEET
jgi:hypothetical protein